MTHRQFYIELTSGQATGHDFAVSDAPPLPAVFPDWVELPSGGTFTFIDGDGNQRAITNAAAGQRYGIQVRKIVTSTQTVRLGTSTAAGLPGPVGATGATGATGSTGATGATGSSRAWTLTALKTGTAYTAAFGELVRMNTAADTMVTLPTAVGHSGEEIGVIDATGGAATHNVTVATTSAQTVNGAAPAAITGAYGKHVYVSDGANWLLEQ